MAFTEAEKASILFALGFSVFEDSGPAMRAINSLDSVESRARPIIQPILEEIDSIRREIRKVKPLAKAVEDGSLKTRAHYTLGVLRSMGREQVGQLAGFIKVKPERDIFSPSLPGDELQGGDPSEARLDMTVGAGSGCR